MKKDDDRNSIATHCSVVCGRCDGDGKAHGSDRPFEWHGPGTYPGPCPVCNGSGVTPGGTGPLNASGDDA